MMVFLHCGHCPPHTFCEPPPFAHFRRQPAAQRFSLAQREAGHPGVADHQLADHSHGVPPPITTKKRFIFTGRAHLDDLGHGLRPVLSMIDRFVTIITINRRRRDIED
jgi:hypothetical protein